MAYIGHTVVKERESCILWGDTTSGPGGGEGQAVSRLGHGVCMVGQGGGGGGLCDVKRQLRGGGNLRGLKNEQRHLTAGAAQHSHVQSRRMAERVES